MTAGLDAADYTAITILVALALLAAFCWGRIVGLKARASGVQPPWCQFTYRREDLALTLSCLVFDESTEAERYTSLFGGAVYTRFCESTKNWLQHGVFHSDYCDYVVIPVVVEPCLDLPDDEVLCCPSCGDEDIFTCFGLVSQADEGEVTDGALVAREELMCDACKTVFDAVLEQRIVSLSEKGSAADTAGDSDGK